MAAEISSMPVNGNYAPQHSFDQQHAANAYASQPYTQAPPASSTSASNSSAQPEIPKDEVGWYFVEQYYTTLSRTPEKLYLYYNKRSQFVSGNETDKVQVCVGQRAINDRIKELNFQDCKVRITNVDSQASDVNIVIQVIGEISNKSQPHRKFTQTFVLATQTNGYFVLNDIFRYMIEEEEETVIVEPTKAEQDVQQVPAAEEKAQEPEPAAVEAEPKTLTGSSDQSAVEQAAQVVDKELEEKVLKEEPKEEQKKEAAPAVKGAEETKEEAPVQQPVAEVAPEVLEEEKPRDPEPTPITEEPPKVSKPAAPAAPAAPVKPAVPKTWASLAASANKSVAMPTPPSNVTPAAASTQTTKPAAKTAPTASAAQATPSAPSAPAAQREASPAATSGDEWTAVSGSHNRQQSRQVNGQAQEPSHPRGYIKNVHENIKGPELKEKLAQFGEINYFDVYRAKTCAFVDFKTPEGYNNAVANCPIQIGNEKFWIEERRAPNNSNQRQFPGGRGNFQQGGSNRGGRGNFRGDGGRGGFGGQRGGRGGAGGRGRGGAQAA